MTIARDILISRHLFNAWEHTAEIYQNSLDDPIKLDALNQMLSHIRAAQYIFWEDIRKD